MSGRQPRQQTHSEELKAAALADVLLIGPGATAAKYQISQRTLFDWRVRYGIAELLPIKKERIGNLAATYLEASLQALTAQAYVASDPEYLNRQSAQELAILHGVMADKSIRLLEAVVGGEQQQSPALADYRPTESIAADRE